MGQKLETSCSWQVWLPIKCSRIIAGKPDSSCLHLKHGKQFVNLSSRSVLSQKGAGRNHPPQPSWSLFLGSPDMAFVSRPAAAAALEVLRPGLYQFGNQDFLVSESSAKMNATYRYIVHTVYFCSYEFKPPPSILANGMDDSKGMFCRS